ncbi:MAG: MupA/Atu3671 family FMN-dependent luciferase-like monooxygenase [Fluviicola sp.]
MKTLKESFRKSCFSFSPFLSIPDQHVEMSYRKLNLALLSLVGNDEINLGIQPLSAKNYGPEEIAAFVIFKWMIGHSVTIDFTASEKTHERFFELYRTALENDVEYLGDSDFQYGEWELTVVISDKRIKFSESRLIEMFSKAIEAVGFTEASVLSISPDLPSEEKIMWTLFGYWNNFHVVYVEASDEVIETEDKFSMDFGVFFFGNVSASESKTNRYRSTLEIIDFADKNDFRSVWTPERHFNDFGGLYPNPSVLSAAIAAKTTNIQIRTGSIVTPHHHPVRIAEDWALIDNLSLGRAAVGFASGWQFKDFVYYPENYENRHDIMFERITQIRELWRGETLEFVNGLGDKTSVNIFPNPLQEEIPIWVTVSGKLETFVDAAKIGANILTHLLWQDPSHLKEKIEVYRKTLEESGFDPNSRKVSVMVHTFLGNTLEEVRAIVYEPLKDYIRSSVHLVETMINGAGKSEKMKNAIGRYGSLNESTTESELEELLEIAFERFFTKAALLGDVDTCAEKIRTYKSYGVDELACLIDFGVASEFLMGSMNKLNELRLQFSRNILKRYAITHSISNNKDVPVNVIAISSEQTKSSGYTCQLNWDTDNFFEIQPNKDLAMVSKGVTIELDDNF